MTLSRNILLASLFCIINSLSAQHEMALHFMPTTLQTGIINPALRPTDHKWGISLFGYNTQINSNLPIRQYISRTSVDISGLLNTLAETDNTLAVNGSAQTIAFGFGIKKLWFGLRNDLVVNSSSSFPAGLPRLILEGNAPYIGQTMQFGPTINMGVYSATALQVAFEATSKLSVGITAKHLLGLGAFNTTKSDLSLYTDPEIYQLTLNTNYAFDLAGIEPSELNVNIDSITGIPSLNTGTSSRTNSNGVGFDIGAAYKISPKLTLRASIIGLGTVTWKTGKNYATSGQFRYEGAKITQLVGQDTLDFGVNLDSLFDGFDVTNTDKRVTYNTPASAYLSAMYRINGQFTVGALFQVERLNKDQAIGGAVHAQWHPTRWIQTGVTIGARQYTAPASVGFHIIVKPGPFQLYYATDNILSKLVPSTTQISGHRVGLNLMFGKRNKE